MQELYEESGEWWVLGSRDWLLIASEIERLRWALKELPQRAADIPAELIEVIPNGRPPELVDVEAAQRSSTVALPLIRSLPVTAEAEL